MISAVVTAKGNDHARRDGGKPAMGSWPAGRLRVSVAYLLGAIRTVRQNALSAMLSAAKHGR